MIIPFNPKQKQCIILNRIYYTQQKQCTILKRMMIKDKAKVIEDPHLMTAAVCFRLM